MLDPKIVCYTHENGQKVSEIASFYDATRVVYRGSRGFEIFLGPKYLRL